MPANEPLQGLPYPLSSDGDDVPRDIKALADAAALKMNMMPRTFATTAARDAFYTANPTLKVAGIVAVIGSGADYAEYVHDGTAWRPWVTAWQAITPGSGFTAGTGVNAPRVRIKGGIVVFSGNLTGGLPAGISTTMGTIAAEFRPPADDGRAMSPVTSGSGVMVPYAAAWADGRVVANPGAAGGSYTVLLGGLSGYCVD